VRNSQFLNSEWGLYHAGDSKWVDIDSSCVFNGNTAAGVYFYQTGTKSSLKHSTINSNYMGVFFDQSSSSAIVGNELLDNPTAIGCFNESSPSIRENLIKSNTYGVTAASEANPDMGDGDNTFAFNDIHVGNFTELIWIAASGNCWNVNTGTCQPKAGKIYVANAPYAGVDTSDPICCSVSLDLVVQLPGPTPEKTVKTRLVAVIPNPFNPTTTIHYDLASQSTVEIRVYDVAGRFVRDLVHGTKVAGSHEAPWDGMDGRGSPVASGVYFVKMVAGRDSFTKKMVLLK